MCAPSSLSQVSTRSKHCHPVTNLSFVFLSLFEYLFNLGLDNQNPEDWNDLEVRTDLVVPARLILLTLHQMRGETRERERGGGEMQGKGHGTAPVLTIPSPVTSSSEEEEDLELDMEEEQEEKKEASRKRKKI